MHPTWFAIEETDNTPEVWKNGIDWWGVPRDYGFTDEIMLYPVRLALTHKAEANVFYNMWYGEGAGFLTSFSRNFTATRATAAEPFLLPTNAALSALCSSCAALES